MKTREAMAVLARHRGDATVVYALGMAANEWWAASRAEDSFYMHGAMGFAASVPSASRWPSPRLRSGYSMPMVHCA